MKNSVLFGLFTFFVTTANAQLQQGMLVTVGQTLKAESDTMQPHRDTVPANLAKVNDSSITSTKRMVDTTVIIPKLDFAGVPVREALTAISRAYGISMFVDSSVTGNLTMRLDNVALNDALQFIVKEQKLAWERTGRVIKVFKSPVPSTPPEPLDVTYRGGLLSCDLHAADLDRLVGTLNGLTRRNIVIQNGASGTVSGTLSDLEFDKAAEVLLTTNGFTFTKIDGVIYVGRPAEGKASGPQARRMDVKCEGGLVSLNVANGGLADVLAVIRQQCNLNLFIQTSLEASVTAQVVSMPVDEAITYVLLNTPYSFRELNGIYFVGSKDSEDLYETRLIKLHHLIAGIIEPLIPTSLSKQISVKVVKEHNGLLLTGPRTALTKLEAFVEEIDVPMAQVLFEVLVVDYTTTDRAEFSITANNFGSDSIGKIYYPNIDLSATGKDLNDDLNSLSRHLGISNLGTLPANFFARLQIMQQEGKANIRSHPKIAALNGHAASIRIGTTQYYLLKSTTIYPSQQTDLSTQTSERFEKVEADMSLEVTPFVNSSGELIVDIKPEFNTPAQTFDPKIPPTINHRVLNSTVRLNNGETIILGGLVQTSKSATIYKFPILGSIPILGRLFQNRSSTDVKSELNIYLTPHVYYGSEGSVDLTEVLKKK